MSAFRPHVPSLPATLPPSVSSAVVTVLLPLLSRFSSWKHSWFEKHLTERREKIESRDQVLIAHIPESNEYSDFNEPLRAAEPYYPMSDLPPLDNSDFEPPRSPSPSPPPAPRPPARPRFTDVPNDPELLARLLDKIHIHNKLSTRPRDEVLESTTANDPPSLTPEEVVAGATRIMLPGNQDPVTEFWELVGVEQLPRFTESLPTPRDPRRPLSPVAPELVRPFICHAQRAPAPPAVPQGSHLSVGPEWSNEFVRSL